MMILDLSKTKLGSMVAEMRLYKMYKDLYNQGRYKEAVEVMSLLENIYKDNIEWVCSI